MGSFMAAILCHECGVRSSPKGNAIWLHFPKAEGGRCSANFYISTPLMPLMPLML
jgi:hypothetical protein